MIIHGEINKTYYLQIMAQVIEKKNKQTILSKNEIIDINRNYYYSIPIEISLCNPGYAYINFQNALKYNFLYSRNKDYLY